MKNLSRWMMISLTGTFTVSSWATTIVERQTGQNFTEKLTLNENYVRIENSRQEAVYTLIDFKKNKMFTINTQQRQAVERSLQTDLLPPALGAKLPPAKPVGELKIIDKGKGPKVAGYATHHYQLTAEGKVCADNYLSAEVAKIADLKGFMQLMEKVSMPSEATVTRLPPCLQAQIKLKTTLSKKGLPLKNLDEKGEVMSEIKSIKTEVTVPEDFFELPKDYEVVTEEEIQKKMEEMMRGGHQIPLTSPAPMSKED